MTAEQGRAKLLGALGLARRAGKLVWGFDAVREAAAKGTATLVLLCGDTSQGTAKRIRRDCQDHCPVVDLPLAQADIGHLFQKPAGVLAVTDKDFATLCQSAICAGVGDKEEPD